jgi:DNA repair photolyase
MQSPELRVFECREIGGIARSKGFEEKGLATYGANVAYKCPHDCAYCSSAAMYRHRRAFQEFGVSPFGRGFAIVDLGVPERLDESILRRLRPGDMVQVCTASDAWAPYMGDVGRRFLRRLLEESQAQVRILTKNAGVADDFDLVARFRDRVTVGLSLTGPPWMEDAVVVIEPFASPLSGRVEALRSAKRLGLRVYGMLCPLLPGISDDEASVRWLLGLCGELDVEDVWAEPVNARGCGLIHTAEALRVAGYAEPAGMVDSIRHKRNWSRYARELVERLLSAAKHAGVLDRLHVLLYGANLTNDDREALEGRSDAIIWL